MKFYIFAQVISCVVSVLTQPYLTHLGEIDLLFRTYLDLTEDFFEIDSNFLFALVVSPCTLMRLNESISVQQHTL